MRVRFLRRSRPALIQGDLIVDTQKLYGIPRKRFDRIKDMFLVGHLSDREAIMRIRSDAQMPKASDQVLLATVDAHLDQPTEKQISYRICDIITSEYMSGQSYRTSKKLLAK